MNWGTYKYNQKKEKRESNTRRKKGSETNNKKITKIFEGRM